MMVVASVEAGPGRRVAVIGDIGGHLSALVEELGRLGVAGSVIPEDLTVIQVGDLIHRGPDSAGVVDLVDGLLAGGRWIQLVGNHEAQYLRRPAFDWPERLDKSSVGTLRRWWTDGQMQVAVAVLTGSEEFLVTHAGLTVGYWTRFLGGVSRATSAARALNSMIGADEEQLFRAGAMLGGGSPELTAGPLWALASTELVPGWASHEMPFSQVHGHTSLADWDASSFGVPAQWASCTTIDPEARHETTTLPSGRIIGLDPGHLTDPCATWRAWVVGEPADRRMT